MKCDPIYVIYGVRARNDTTMEYRYVGLTLNLEARIYTHKIQSNDRNSHAYHTPKSKWMRKHLNLVEYDTLETCPDPESLKIAEQKWIHIFSERGYRLMNLTAGGEGTFGWTPTPEWRAKQSARMSDPEKNPSMFKSGPLHHMYGQKVSDDHRRRISESKIGLKNPRCKLTVEQIREMRKLRDEGVRPMDLESIFSVSKKTVYRICKNIRYPDI